MSFIKGMAAGIVAGAVLSMVAMPKPKRYASHVRREAGRAASSIGDLVDSVISVLR